MATAPQLESQDWTVTQRRDLVALCDHHIEECKEALTEESTEQDHLITRAEVKVWRKLRKQFEIKKSKEDTSQPKSGGAAGY